MTGERLDWGEEQKATDEERELSETSSEEEKKTSDTDLCKVEDPTCEACQ